MTTHSDPLLTVVVPTRNRPETALMTVRTLLQIPDDRLEVVVQDCSDDERLAQTIGSVSDTRLRYRRGTPVSMSANWNRALESVSGEFVCFIGDDDGVHPDIMLATRWAEKNRLEAFAAPTPAWFCWSDHPVSSMASTLLLDRFSGRISYPDGQEEIRKSSFGFGQQIRRLPRIYHGIVKHSLLDRLRSQTGKYFDSVSPDFYAAYALGALVGRYCIVDFPLTISGTSRSSNAARTKDPRYGQKSHYALLFSENAYTSVSDLVPRCPAHASCVCSSMLTAFQNLSRTDLISNIDLPLLYASTIMDASGERLSTLNQFFRAVNTTGRPLARNTVLFAACWAARGIQRPASRMRAALRRTTRRSVARGVDDIAAATRELTRHYGRESASFPRTWIDDS
jgi:glycosyltransferase involved in cell wall biosynthesis